MRNDVTRTTLAVLFIGVLIIASLWILRPFLAPVIWATMVVVATWPLMLKVERALWGRRSLAVAVMTLAMLLVFVLPFWTAIGAIVDYSDKLGEWARHLKDFKVPQPPAMVELIPVFGGKIASMWRDFAAMAPDDLAARLGPYAGIIARWIAGEAGTIGALLMQFLLTVVIAAVMYSGGETAARGVRRFAHRLAGQRGDDVAVLAAQAIRGVALGVVVTALVQSTLGGLGLLVAGVPFAGLLTAVMLMFCLAQLGPTLVLVPAVAWLYWTGDNVWGTVLLVWTLFVGTLDNFLRPYLIKMGADLPLLLIFAGVIGGLVSLGLLGIFVGPVVLAVSYTLLKAWIDDAAEQPAPTDAPARGDKAASR
ncbi:MAG TPA: AI-2E family transporter YdiK [Casimicrobiaceae bacterium]|nr:AI-2E family transporter YdiK [Casimicrobiaceae bacterium]